MSLWFRLYTELLNDPKAQRLPGEQFKGWINLLCLAKEHDGLLPSIEDTAFRLRINEADAERLVEELAKRGLLDRTDDGITPHNWEGRQFLSDDDPTAALRSRRYRQRNVTRDATDNVTDASQPASRSPEQRQSRAETEPESEQSRGGSGENPSPPASRVKRAAASRRVLTCNEEFFEELQANPAYAGLDVRRVYHKMVAWCQVKHKQPTRGRLVNWLSREDPPMTTNSKLPKTGNAYVGKSGSIPIVDPVENPEANNAFMAKYIEDLISLEDLIHLGHEYDAIIKRGGAKAEWEIKCCAYYELHRDEPATPEQMAELKASITALANKQ